MRRTAAAALLSAVAAFGCRGPSDLTPASEPRVRRVERLLDAARRDPQAYELLAGLLRVAPKRLSGSDGADRAVEWGVDTMRRLGFDRVRAEPVKVPTWVRGPVEEARVFLGGKAPAEGEELRVAAIGGSPSTPVGGVEAAVVEVKSFDELRALGKRAEGKIVFYNRPMDPGDRETFRAYGGAVDQRGGGAREARKAGAVAALVRSVTTKLDNAPHTGWGAAFLEDGKTPVVPVAAVSALGAERLHEWLQAHGDNVRVKLRLSCRFEEDRPSANVVGELAGAETAEEIVLVGAHLDAWDTGDGAHDDGAGCAHVLEALRLLKTLGVKPKRTIRAVLFMNEENGLAGGRGYAEAHAGERHVLAFESDGGGFTPWILMLTRREPVWSRVKGLEGPLRAVGLREVREGGGGADISPLDKTAGALGQLVTEPSRYFDYHHAETDVLSAVDGWELELGAVAIAAVLWEIADL